MLEGEYLELVDDLKKKFDEKDKEVEKLKEQVDEYRKTILSIYGWIRISAILLHDGILDEDTIYNQLDNLRSFLSNWFDENV